QAHRVPEEPEHAGPRGAARPDRRGDQRFHGDPQRGGRDAVPLPAAAAGAGRTCSSRGRRRRARPRRPARALGGGRPPRDLAGPAEIWPVLRDFLTGRGYAIEVADAELGVLETGWSEPVNEGGLARRTKFRIFSEPGADPGSTLLVISGMLGEQTPAAGGGGE